MEKKKALIIVDIQKDFCPGGTLPVPNGDEVVEPLNWMIDYAVKHDWLVIASRDWHPGYHGAWPPHCLQNSKGAEFHPRLNLRNAVIVSKGTQPNEDAYSVFNGQTENGQSLLDLLKNRGIEEVFIGGLATDYCVKATAVDAAQLGFETYLLLDAYRAVNLNPDDEKDAIEEMKKAGVVIISTQVIHFLYG